MSLADAYVNMIRVPNSEVWIAENSVVAVARLADSQVGSPKALVTAINFQLRLIDGKSINVQSVNRAEIRKFLIELGISWDNEKAENV